MLTVHFLRKKAESTRITSLGQVAAAIGVAADREPFEFHEHAPRPESKTHGKQCYITVSLILEGDRSGEF